jgi:hypothetical protein
MAQLLFSERAEDLPHDRARRAEGVLVERLFLFAVPLVVDVGTGPNWDKAH